MLINVAVYTDLQSKKEIRTMPANGDPDLRIERELNVINAEYEEISELDRDLDDQLEAVCNEFSCNENDPKIRIKVKKVNEETGGLGDCFECTPAHLPVIERIRKEFGYGKYQIWVYRGNKLIKRPNLELAKPLIDESQLTDSSNNISTILQPLLDDKQKQSEKYDNLVAALISNGNNNNTPAVDPMAMMGAMMGVMMQMKDFMAPKENANSLGDLLENIKTIQEITDGGSGGETNFLDLAKSFGPGLLQVTKKLADQQEIGPQEPPQAQQPQNHQPEVQQPQTNTEDEEGMNLFKYQLNILVSKAEKESDPSLYADLIMDSIPRDKLEAFLEMDDVIGYLIQTHPGVEKYKAWFEALIVEINESMNDEYEEEDEEIEIEKTTEIEKDTDVTPSTVTEKERTTVTGKEKV
ncbi:MAG: hypothetical protein ABW166_04970 [Sedimenticola sp.]